MKRLIRHGFNRRYVLWPVLASVALVVTVFFVTEARRSETVDLVRSVNDEQSFLMDLTELLNASYEAESAQRGYIITGYEAYIEPFDAAVKTASERIAALEKRKLSLPDAEAAELDVIEQSFSKKLKEMNSTIAMRRSGRLGTALSVLNSDAGLNYMREISRRAWIAVELDSQVRERTAELAELSVQLLRVGEMEKSALSRELHDELGGLLVAMKLDLAALKKLLPPEEGATARAQRLGDSIDAGIDLKRRVIESLRPTLLDNLGLFAALRWLAGEAATASGVRIEFDAPREEAKLPADVSIAIFRVVQETLTNMLRHAKAARATIMITILAGGVDITIRDDGIGLPPDALKRSGSHGLKQMRFRMAAVGGAISWEAAPGGGTLTRVSYHPTPSVA